MKALPGVVMMSPGVGLMSPGVGMRPEGEGWQPWGIVGEGSGGPLGIGAVGRQPEGVHMGVSMRSECR